MSARNGGPVFFDTNILIYAFSPTDYRNSRARALVSDGGVISIQILNELVSVARRRLNLDWLTVRTMLAAVRSVSETVAPLTDETQLRALDIAERYGFHIYDASILAAAQLAGCRTLYSEDMQDGQSIGGLTIRNPFSAAA